MKKSEKKRLTRVFFCLYAISLLVLFAGINRLCHVEVLRVPVIDILRMCDLNVMFIFAPLLIMCFAFLLYFYKGYKNLITLLAFILGTYMTGVGFGLHEPFNIARSVYKYEMMEGITRTARFMDDGLGHWTFFAGFMLISLAIVFAELRKPFSEKIPGFNIAVATVTAVISGIVIYFNMAWEKTVPDLSVIGACLVIVLLLKFFRGNPSFGRVPMTYTMCTAYALGLFGTLLHWLLFR